MVQEKLSQIDAFLRSVDGGHVKAAEANTELGSVGGETTHPIKSVDDSTQPAEEGDRTSENSADVKKNEGEASVDSTDEITTEGDKQADALIADGSASDVQPQKGTKQAPTGEDPAAETGSVKTTQSDTSIGGKSSHPARTDNDELDGFKFANMNNSELYKAAASLGDKICMSLLTSSTEKGTADAAKLAHAAGTELAGLFTTDFNKEAADQMILQATYDIVKTASQDAENVALAIYRQLKLAEGELPPDVIPPDAGGMPPDAAGGVPPEAAGRSAGPDAGGQEELLATLEALGINSVQDLEALLSATIGGGGEGGPEGGMPPGPPPGGPEGGMPPGPPPGGPEGGMPPGPPPGMEVTAAAKIPKTAQDQILQLLNETFARSRR